MTILKFYVHQYQEKIYNSWFNFFTKEAFLALITKLVIYQGILTTKPLKLKKNYVCLLSLTNSLYGNTIAESFYNVNYGSSIIMSKSLSKNLSNQNAFVFVVFKTKRELKRQNELFLKYHFSGNTSFMFSLMRLFDKLLT